MVYSIDFQWAGLHNAHDRRAHWGTMEQCTEHLQHFTIGGQYIYYEVQCEIGSRCAVSTNISTIWINIENLLKWLVNIADGKKYSYNFAKYITFQKDCIMQ